jgi:hypothetical protein
MSRPARANLVVRRFVILVVFYRSSFSLDKISSPSTLSVAVNSSAEAEHVRTRGATNNAPQAQQSEVGLPDELCGEVRALLAAPSSSQNDS